MKQEPRYFTDDHLPCIEFEHKGRKMSLWWTSHEIAAAVDVFVRGESDKPIDRAAPGFKVMLDHIETWEGHLECEVEEDGTRTFHTDYGMLTWGPKTDNLDP